MTTFALAGVGGVGAAAATSTAPAASADAYGVLAQVALLPTHVPADLGPLAHATQDYPPGAAHPASASILNAGPLPADASVVNHVGAVTSTASANSTPVAHAKSTAADVSLLGATGSSIITADAVTAESTSNCTSAPSAAGTEFVNLKVNGTPFAQAPAPNTVIDLVVAKVILNEQHPANDGRGLVVNAIHVVSTSTGDPLFRGDIIISHAMSTVSCPNGAGTTGGASEIKMTKDAAPTEAFPGTTVTYTAKVTNSSTSACLVNEFIEHLAPAFDFVSTSGDFGNALDATQARPGGGTDLSLGNGKTIAASGTFTQTFVVKVKDAAAAGTYFNNLEILCSNLGDYVKGLDAPVHVNTTVVAPTPTPTPTSAGGGGHKPQCSDGIDNDGDGKIDFPADPGCSSRLDNDEANLPVTGTSGDVSLTAIALVLLVGGAAFMVAARPVRRRVGG